jgi:hypothetical protein
VLRRNIALQDAPNRRWLGLHNLTCPPLLEARKDKIAREQTGHRQGAFH